MANFVVKKDGTKVAFDINKIKNAIAKAAQSTDLDQAAQEKVREWVANNVAGALASREEVSTIEIRDMVLAELDKMEPKVSAAWRAYDSQKAK